MQKHERIGCGRLGPTRVVVPAFCRRVLVGEGDRPGDRSPDAGLIKIHDRRPGAVAFHPGGADISSDLLVPLGCLCRNGPAQQPATVRPFGLP